MGDRVKYTKSQQVLQDFMCPICHNDKVRSNETFTSSLCKHTFCKGCIKAWVSRGNDSCPLCRGVMYRNDILNLMHDFYTVYPRRDIVKGVVLSAPSSRIRVVLPETDILTMRGILQELYFSLREMDFAIAHGGFR